MILVVVALSLPLLIFWMWLDWFVLTRHGHPSALPVKLRRRRRHFRRRR